MKQGERSWDLRGVGVLSERREKKKSKREVFILYKDNIILMDKRATVTVYIYTITIARLSIKIILSLYNIKTSFSLFFFLSSH